MKNTVFTRDVKCTRLISTLLVLAMMIGCLALISGTAFAAESTIEMNISKSPCKGNRSSYPLPEGVSELIKGESYYINMAATKDLCFDCYEIYIKEPGQSNYNLVDSYDPLGYFRWYYFQYRFAKEGTYYIMPVITATDGTQYSGEFSFNVKGNGNGGENVFDENTYFYNRNPYNVTPHFKNEYCFNQKDYSRFLNKKGQNRGCTATAMCTAYSIYHDSALSPNDVKWSTAGTSWEYCKRYKENKRTYFGNTYTQKEALKCAYNCISNGTPMIIGVNGAGCDHVVTAVGIRDGADYNNLSLSDILIVDPNGGGISTLGKYTSIDTGWGLRVPID